MRYRDLGRSGLLVGEIGFGCMTFGSRLFNMGAAWFLLLLVLLPTDAIAEEAEKPIWLVVTRNELVSPLLSLSKHRIAQGFEVEFAAGSSSEAADVERAIASLPRPPAFVLIVGDDEVGRTEDALWLVRAPRRPLYRWRAPQRKDFAADAVLGDRDGDLLPDVPVGRIPARTPEEVTRVVEKILAYERRAPTEEDLRLLVWGGAPGYGPQIDAMATGMLLTTVRRHAPKWAVPWMISAAAGQPLCGWPPDHPGRFLTEMRRGGAMGAILAHANEDQVISMRHDKGWVFLSRRDVDGPLAKGPPTSPLYVLSCESGRFDRPKAGIAEALLMAPGGPVAVVAATTESHPLTNYFTGVELLRGLRPGPARLGVRWVEAQRAGYESRDFLAERMLRDVEGKLEETIDVGKLRRDQPLMYALLGDPATALKLPHRLEATVTRTEKGWRWSVKRPEGASSLSVSVRRFRAPPTGRAKEPLLPEEARKVFEAANAVFDYEILPPPAKDAPWAGEVVGRGTLRLVARTPSALHVATFPLE